MRIRNISIDDAVLVDRYRRGDSDSMKHLIIKYQNRIYNVILKICANTADAAELSQDTFVKVLENIDKFQGRSSFYTWLFRIAVNLTLSYCARSVKLGFRSLDAEDSGQKSHANGLLRDFLQDDGVPDPAVIAENNELVELVLIALMRLADEQRTVIILRDIEGMSYAQIAEVLEIELGTVKSRLSRARSNLKEIMEVILE